MSTTTQDCALVFGDSPLAAAIAQRLAQDGLPVHDSQGTDPADRGQLDALFAQLAPQPRLVVLATANAAAGSAMEMSIAEAGAHWRRIAYAGSQLGQTAIPAMLTQQQGTLLFLAPSDSTNAGVAAAAAGLRSLAQSMAREFGPKNLHVAFLAVDAAADPEAVAHTAWQLHRQHRTAWTQELDLRA